MIKLNTLLAVAGATAFLMFGTSDLAAQGRGGQGGGRGGFDPEQMRTRMMERMKEQLEVTNDAEWKIIEERLAKVMEARRSGRGGGMMFGRRGGGPGGPGGDAQGDRRRPGSEPDPAMEDLQKALDSKASPEEIKSKLAKFRESRKANEAKLKKAQDELRQVLTVRQEAMCVMMGTLE